MLKADGSVNNLLRVWNEATAWEREDGKLYYSRQRQRVMETVRGFPFGLMAAAGAFAALSPNNDETGNYRDLRICARYAQNDIIGPLVISSYPANGVKALAMLRGAYPDTVLKGLKTTAFYHNTINPSDPYWITVDGHMVSAWLGRRVLLRRRDDATKESAEMNRSTYHRIAADVRTAAKSARVLPCVFQSTVWGTWKRLHKIRYKPQLTLSL